MAENVKVFKIEWPDEFGQDWLEARELAIYMVRGYHVGATVTDITDEWEAMQVKKVGYHDVADLYSADKEQDDD